jgi:hypothetical protein
VGLGGDREAAKIEGIWPRKQEERERSSNTGEKIY